MICGKTGGRRLRASSLSGEACTKNITVVVFDQPFKFPNLGRISVGPNSFVIILNHLKPLTSGEAGTTNLKTSKIFRPGIATHLQQIATIKAGTVLECKTAPDIPTGRAHEIAYTHLSSVLGSCPYNTMDVVLIFIK